MLHCESPSSTASKSSAGPSGGTATARTQTSNAKTDHLQSKSVSPIRRSRSISPVKEGAVKQQKKPDPTVSLTPAKGKPSEAPRDANSVRARKAVRAATVEEPAVNTASDGRKEAVTLLQETGDKEKNAKAKSTNTKRKNTAETPEDSDNAKEKTGAVRATAGSATAAKEGARIASSPPTKPSSVKSPVNGAESKNVKTSSNSVVALKLTNSAAASAATKKKQGKENSAIREEKPNRGS